MNHAIVSFILKKMSTMITYRKSEIPTHLQQYFQPAEIGLEQTPEQYVAEMVAVFREVRRVLRDDGCAWLNLGDSYASEPFEPWGVKPKDELGIPDAVVNALRLDGWYRRQTIIWHKPNPMPESVTDRCTKAHEYIFLLTKSARYWYDAEAVKENGAGGRERFSGDNYGAKGLDRLGRNDHGRHDNEIAITRNRRSVWTVPTQPYSGAHFAVFPPELIKPCILAGCPDQCCPKCGKGWERVTERVTQSASVAGPKSTDKKKQGIAIAFSGYADGSTCPNIRTIGFRPSCDCCPPLEDTPDCFDPLTIPGTVLDPFNGSGTTGLVALQTNRKYVGCELNPEYIELTRKRLDPEMAQGRLSL